MTRGESEPLPEEEGERGGRGQFEKSRLTGQIHEQSVIETRQSTATKTTHFFPREKEELPQARFESAC